jgi:hypothetical protein
MFPAGDGVTKRFDTSIAALQRLIQKIFRLKRVMLFQPTHYYSTTQNS